jgi:pimeloyl-ACP methyl ester carboxylesterase
MEVRVGGRQIGYRTWGSNDNPPFVLMHSTSFGAWMWEEVVGQLDNDFYIVATDQRGHGDSEPSDGPVAMEDLARDLKAALDQLGVSGAPAAGHSSGSTTLAICEALYPGTFSKLLLIEPILLPVDQPFEGPNPMAEQARKRRTQFDSADAMFEGFRGRPPFNTWTDEALRLYCLQGTRLSDGDEGIELKCNGESEARLYEAVMRFNAADYFPKVKSPVTLVRGENSDGMRAPMFERARKMFNNPPEIVVPQAGHFVPQEEPSAVARLIREFVAS